MAIHKTAAIVLHSQKQGETSKILLLYTRQFGTISLMVKGAHNIRGKQWGALQTLSRVQLVFYHRENRSLHYGQQVDLEDPYKKIHNSLGKTVLASIPCEIILKAEEREHPNSRLFDLLQQTLEGLENKESGLRNIIRCFEWQYMELTGIKPRLDRCLQCGNSAIEEKHTLLIDQGGLACLACAPPGLALLPISGKALAYFRWLDQIALDRSDQAQISGTLGKEIDFLLLTFMRYHVETLKNLSSLQLVESLRDTLPKDAQE